MVTITVYVLILSSILYMWMSSFDIIASLAPSAIAAGIGICLSVLVCIKRKQILITKNARIVLFISILLSIWIIFIYAINGDMPRRVLQILFGILICFSVYNVIESKKHLYLFIYINVFGILVSSLFGFGFRYIGEPFISIWLNLRGELSDISQAYDVIKYNRLVGLTHSPIQFSYQLVMVIPMIVGVYVFRLKNMNFFVKMILLIIIFILGYALIGTQVRSAIIGCLFAIFFILLYRIKKTKWFLLSPIIVGGIYVAIAFILDTSRLIDIRDPSVGSRIPMILTSINYGFSNLIPTGFYNPTLQHIPSFVTDPKMIEIILNSTSHNQFLNVFTYYGFIGLLLLAIFYLYIYRVFTCNKMIMDLKQDSSFVWIIVGLAGGFFAYIINSMAHNAGPFIGDTFNWYYIGLFLSVDKLVSIDYNKIKNKKLD